MRYLLAVILFINSFHFLFSQEECRKQPAFITKLGFDVSKSAISSSEDRMMGPVLIEVENPDEYHSARKRFYQDSTWLMAGFVGPIVVDNNGDVYTVPHPFVNALMTSFEDLNTIYRIGSRTGKMEKFLSVPVDKIPHFQNPYGILGLSFDCASGQLIASTVSGSSEKEEAGKIVSVDPKTQKITTIIEGIDVMGIFIAVLDERRRLFYGKARNSEIWSVPVNKENQIDGEHRLEVSLSGLGYRGDDKARKILLRNDRMFITGVPFYYNLTAPRIKQESTYVFKFNRSRKIWEVESIN